MRNFYLFLTNRNMATRLNVVNPPLREARNDLIYPPRADFRWDFTSSIIPQQSMGSIAFTRATTATVTDNEWVIRNCLSGEARFQWARRVQNLHQYSEDITNAIWNPASCTRTKNAWIAPDGTMTAWLVTSAAATTLTEFNQNYNIVSGQTYILSVSLKANGWLQYVQLVWNGATFWLWYINVDLSNGTITANVPWAGNMQATVTPEANWFYRIQFKATAIATVANNHLSVAMMPSGTSVRIATFPWDGIKWFYYWHPQFEDVTGQSVQTAAEYVSTNVLTATPYHGANVDGVKYFDTTIAWLPISPDTLKGFLCEWARTNLFLQSEDFSSIWWYKGGGSVVADFALSPSWYTNADKFVPTAWTSQSYLTQSVTVTASIYTISFYLKSAWKQFVQMDASGFISNGYVNFDIVNGVVWGSNLWSGYIEAVTWFPWMYRCSITTETVTAWTWYFSLFVVDSNSAARWSTSVNNGTDSIIVWWAQFEQWRNASSYIPTTTTTATRNIDSLIMDTTNSVNKYGACSFIYTLEDNEQFDRRAFSFTGNTTNRLQFQVKRVWSGANLFYWDGAGVPSITPGRDVWANNVVIAWTNLSNVSLYMDNTKYNSGVAPNLIFTTVDIGSAGGQPWFWCIKNVRIWKTRPTDAELLALSNSSY